jgi:hypothetical protein
MERLKSRFGQKQNVCSQRISELAEGMWLEMKSELGESRAGAFDCFPMGLANRTNAEGRKLLTNFLAP